MGSMMTTLLSPISSALSWIILPLYLTNWSNITWPRVVFNVPMFDCRIRLVAVATQKFVAEVASDALQHCKARQAAVVKDKRDKQQKDKRLILTMDDLSKSLREYGVNVKHQEYFADSPSTGMDPASRDE
ncbi:transcription initiation factor TFIID subunit 10-like isoform X2 [Durio zibethinus]|uniref:Transcription initiation factor TFIID subunit 10-like isoform X2 n=1 Tax=Durio zibethinus TaxID=66656 RepID=A0A6P5XN23_DURZI|nr:transcription initiation factor TFIID subunit 10-like isoform X2 [Durio zibethinus]